MVSASLLSRLLQWIKGLGIDRFGLSARLDLNRDFIKTEAAEVRGLLSIIRQVWDQRDDASPVHPTCNLIS